MKSLKFIKNKRHIFSYSGVNKAKILFNIIRLLFYKLINKKFVIVKIYGNKMLLDLRTPGTSQALFVYNKREFLDTEILMKELKHDMNVLDIGANIGYYVLLEASLLDNGKVYAFEPDPRNIEILEKNIKINNFSEKVKLYPYAVAEKDCVRKFSLSEQTNLNSFTRKYGNIGHIEVKCMKLNDFAKEKKINFLRMDIEGYECMAIAGMLDFLREKQDLKLQIELHPSVFNIGEFSFLEELSMLEKFGFRTKYLISAGKARQPKIIQKGYKPIKTVIEGRLSRGLYENIKMEDLLFFLNDETKIVRSILLCK